MLPYASSGAARPHAPGKAGLAGYKVTASFENQRLPAQRWIPCSPETAPTGGCRSKHPTSSSAGTSRLSGLFIFPVDVLARFGAVGHKPMHLPLHPPWHLAKKQATRLKYAWQLEYFVDLRTWDGEAVLQSRINCLLSAAAIKKHWVMPQSGCDVKSLGLEHRA